MLYVYIGYRLHTVNSAGLNIISAICKVMLLVDWTQSTKILTAPSVVKFPSINMGSNDTSYKRGRMSRGRRRSSPARLAVFLVEYVEGAPEAASTAVNSKRN